VKHGILVEAHQFCFAAAVAIHQHFHQLRRKHVGLERKLMIATHTVQRFL